MFVRPWITPLIVLVSLGAQAQTDAILDDLKGFQKVVGNAAIPEAIREKSKAVFQILILSEGIASTPSALDNEKLLTESSPSAKKFLAYEKKRCADSRVEFCKLYVVEEAGTAFLADNQRSLYSAAHVFQKEFLRIEKEARTKKRSASKVITQQLRDYLETLESMQKILPDFVLLDQNGAVIFDTRDRFDFALVKTILTPRLALGLILERHASDKVFQLFESQRWLEANELVHVELSRSLNVEPLQFSDPHEKIPAGTPVFALGYPGVYADRHNLPQVPDSDGASLYLTAGTTMGLPDRLIFKQTKDELPKETRNTYSQLLTLAEQLSFHANNEVASGMSGGPILDQDGRVVSIVNIQGNAMPIPYLGGVFPGLLEFRDLVSMVASDAEEKK